MLKRPKLQDGFQGRGFSVRESVVGVHDQLLLSSLVDVEGDVSEISIINLLILTSLGSTGWWEACS